MQRLAAFGAVIVVIAASATAGNKLPVFVSVPPQKYFVRQIGKELVDVEVMVPAGADAHTYEPKPRQMVALSKARLYFAVGIQPLENIWLKKIASAHPNLTVVHTDQAIEKIPMVGRDHHRGGNDHNEAAVSENGRRTDDTEPHETSELDPHIWLSPPLVVSQAHKILNALIEVDPANRAAYEANYKAFVSELTALDAEFKTIFAGKQGFQFMVLHPAWGYFAHGYGLKQVPIEIEGKDPKPAQLKELIDYAKQKRIKIIFVQPQFSPRSAELVAREIGGQVVYADPLAADWFENLREVAAKFKAAVK